MLNRGEKRLCENGAGFTVQDQDSALRHNNETIRLEYDSNYTWEDV
jgi:hypothetical protein